MGDSMNDKKRKKIIDGSSDGHNGKTAVEKPHFYEKISWVKIVFLAACFAILFGVIYIAANYNSRPSIDKADVVQACIIGDEYYELILDDELLKERGLSRKITTDMIGDYIGSCRLESDRRMGKAYDYLGYKGDSVLILELESQYFYLFYCNPMNSDVTLSMAELMSRYGLTEDNITNITVDGKAFAADEGGINIADELLKSTALSGQEFEDAVFKGKTEEEQQAMRDGMKSAKIVVHGNSADTLVIDCYPSIGYAFSANTCFELTPELKNLFD